MLCSEQDELTSRLFKKLPRKDLKAFSKQEIEHMISFFVKNQEELLTIVDGGIDIFFDAQAGEITEEELITKIGTIATPFFSKLVLLLKNDVDNYAAELLMKSMRENFMSTLMNFNPQNLENFSKF